MRLRSSTSSVVVHLDRPGADRWWNRQPGSGQHSSASRTRSIRRPSRRRTTCQRTSQTARAVLDDCLVASHGSTVPGGDAVTREPDPAAGSIVGCPGPASEAMPPARCPRARHRRDERHRLADTRQARGARRAPGAHRSQRGGALESVTTARAERRAVSPIPAPSRPRGSRMRRRASGSSGGLDVVVVNAAAGTYGPLPCAAGGRLRPHDREHLHQRGLHVRVGAAAPRGERGDGGRDRLVAGKAAIPLMSPYVAAKHALRGFVRGLQIELASAGSQVTVSLVSPGPVDTPFWRNVTTGNGRMPPRSARRVPSRGRRQGDSALRGTPAPRGDGRRCDGGRQRRRTSRRPAVRPADGACSRLGHRRARLRSPRTRALGGFGRGAGGGGLSGRPSVLWRGAPPSALST